MKLSFKQVEKIKHHTLRCYPEEMCGVLVGDDFFPIPNIAENKLISFALDSEHLAVIASRYKIDGIVHSHCRNIRHPEVFDTRTPSIADLNGQKQSKIPWLIVATEGETVTPPLTIPRIPSKEYVGRPFIWFINDCYTLVQDYYLFELGISLPDSKAEKDYKELRHFEGLFDNFIDDYGFSDLTSRETLLNGDLLLVDNAGSRRNHLAIVHNNRLLHQDMLSVDVPMETFVGRIHRQLRYRGI